MESHGIIVIFNYQPFLQVYDLHQKYEMGMLLNK